MKSYRLINDTHLANCFANIKELYNKYEKGTIQIVIKRWKQKRTNEQNKLMWVWHEQFAVWFRIHKNQKKVNKDWIYDKIFLPTVSPIISAEYFTVIILPNGKTETIIIGSSQWSKVDMIAALELYEALKIEWTGTGFERLNEGA